jgi:hypothetical protein
LESGDGFANAGKDAFFAENGENRCEVGAGLLLLEDSENRLPLKNRAEGVTVRVF